MATVLFISRTDLVKNSIIDGNVDTDKFIQFIKVAQENEEAVDISGMRIDDVVKLIKGPKGTRKKIQDQRAHAELTRTPM